MVRQRQRRLWRQPVGRNPDMFPNDATQCVDEDGDGYGDNLSGFNPDPFLFDRDNDGYNDSIDVRPDFASPGDLDGDLTPDEDDAFPNDATEQRDTDGDNIGDEADPDDDNDGYLDDAERNAGTDPLDASSKPVDTYELVVPGTQIGLGAWESHRRLRRRSPLAVDWRWPRDPRQSSPPLRNFAQGSNKASRP